MYCSVQQHRQRRQHYATYTIKQSDEYVDGSGQCVEMYDRQQQRRITAVDRAAAKLGRTGSGGAGRAGGCQMKTNSRTAIFIDA